jgi:hypothetical protein
VAAGLGYDSVATIRTREIALLIQDHAELFLEAHVTQQRIQRLAAGNGVVRVIASSIRASDKVLYACVRRRQLALAKEAESALGK